jgi:hypothetical protein
MMFAGWRKGESSFLRLSPKRNLALFLAFALAANLSAAGEAGNDALTRETSSMRIVFDARQPGISALSIDSLKRSSFRASPLIDPGVAQVPYKVTTRGGWVQYAAASDPGHPVWEMRCAGDTLQMRSLFRPGGVAHDLTWKFDPHVTHATLLGHVTPAGDIALPAVLHLPGMGSLRAYARGNDAAVLRYVAHRNTNGMTPIDLAQPQSDYVTVTFPAASAEHRVVEYTLQTAAIFPAIPGMDPTDARFDGFRRDFLDIFQLHAELHVLANHAASDPCAFTVYEYADMARYTPELVKGLTALDLIRETLDRYLGGFLGYGLPGYQMFDAAIQANSPDAHVFTDTYPSLLISAYDYVDGSGDERWLRQNYKGLRKWAETLLVANADSSPLLEYPGTGNSGSWKEGVINPAANWWDTIGFGHQDAYGNALGYRALRGMAALADRIGEKDDAARYRARADAIRAAYADAFLDPSTGVVGGWRSSDGQLHNYYFPYINGIAVRYGLIEGTHGRQVMDRILAKMESVGYGNFGLGLPGNLVPIRHADYLNPDHRWGGGKKADGSDGFEIYENGGATGCFAYFTMAALYHVGEKEQGDKILMPMLDAFAKQRSTGRAPDGLTYDWKDWHGGAHGYEGFLVDNYYALLAVLDRADLVKMP